MAFRLSTESLTHSIKHLCRYGDTDVFPHLPELTFLREQQAAVTQELSNLDLDNFNPIGAIEALVPKSRFGFRIVHQMPLVDTVLLLAAVIEIGPRIEKYRQKPDKLEAFSYRFQPSEMGAIFRLNHTYKDWLIAQQKFVQSEKKITNIVSTDISDFYARVNLHRLENLFIEIAPNHGAARYIVKHIKAIRGKQSFGLPVGGSAARLLAELALADTDSALKQDNRLSTRFVDDFRIFLLANENPYDALAKLAEQLGLSEGLSLNAAKTQVETRAEFLSRLKHLVTDISEEAEGARLEALTSELYFDDEPDPEEMEKLKSLNLLCFLREEIRKDAFDMGRIKVIFRALKLAKPPAAIKYLTKNFPKLVVFAKEMTLLMQALAEDHWTCFDALSDTVVETILAPPASSIQLIRIWLLELFVRGVVPIEADGIQKLEQQLRSPLDRRQILLIRGRNKDQIFFRRNKTAFGQLSPIEKPCFILGASCLPKDEFRTWLTAAKPMFAGPTNDLFLKWAQQQRDTLINKHPASSDDHQE